MVLNFLKSSYQSVKAALSKTGSLLGDKIKTLFRGGIDEESLEELEQLLYEADLGVKTAMELTEKVRDLKKCNKKLTSDELIEKLKEEVVTLIDKATEQGAKKEACNAPKVVLVIGVNGSGKTTSVAKIAHSLKASGEKVLVAAADTFRAAAVEQLESWAKNIGIDIVKGVSGCDPAAVAFDAVTAALSRKCDTVIIDTAGRLQNKNHLMQELSKIKRATAKVVEGSPHETLLVIDANTGQNGIDQARVFHSHTPLTGLVLTKLDGNAKGGVVVAVQRELGIPVRYIGVGEKVEDLKPFDKESFVEALFG